MSNGENNDLDVGQDSGSTSLKIVGRSGQFKILKPGTTDQYIMFSFDKLQEIDPFGAIEQEALNFGVLGTGLKWSAIQPIPADFGVAGNMTTLTLTGIQILKVRAERGADEDSVYVTGPDFSFALTLYVFTGAGSYMFAGKSWAVTAGQVKFKLDIASFPFLKPTNFLRFGIQMNQSGGADTNVRTKANSGDTTAGTTPSPTDANNVAIAIGPGTISIPMYVVLDGIIASSTKSISTAVPDTEDGESETPSTEKIQTQVYTNKEGTGVQWTFANFTSTLSFDPVIDTTVTPSTSGYAVLPGTSVTSTYIKPQLKTVPSTPGKNNTMLWIGLGIGGGVLVLAGSFYAYRVHLRHKKQAKPAQQSLFAK